MTAQVGDEIEFERETYDLADHHHSLFEPAQYGIFAIFMGTHSYRGYNCRYVIKDGALRLRRLYLGLSEAGRNRELGGVLPTHDPLQGCYVYDGLDLVVPFSGRLLISRDFISELHFHAPFQNAWKHRVAIEIVLEGGRVVSTTDCSELIRRIRRFVLQRASEQSIESILAETPEPSYWRDLINGVVLPPWIEPGFAQAHDVRMWMIDFVPSPIVRQSLRIVSAGPDRRRVVSVLKQTLGISSVRALLMTVLPVRVILFESIGDVATVFEKLREAGATVEVKDVGPRVPLDFEDQAPTPKAQGEQSAPAQEER